MFIFCLDRCSIIPDVLLSFVTRKTAKRLKEWKLPFSKKCLNVEFGFSVTTILACFGLLVRSHRMMSHNHRVPTENLRDIKWGTAKASRSLEDIMTLPRHAHSPLNKQTRWVSRYLAILLSIMQGSPFNKLLSVKTCGFSAFCVYLCRVSPRYPTVSTLHHHQYFFKDVSEWWMYQNTALVQDVSCSSVCLQETLERAIEADTGRSQEAAQLYRLALKILLEGLQLNVPLSGLGPMHSNVAKWRSDMNSWQLGVQDR